MSSTPCQEVVLVVDDSEATIEVLRRNLEAHGYCVRTALGVDEAQHVLSLTPIDLVVTDLKMPRTNGIELVRYVRDNYRDTEVMVITGFPDVDAAVTSLKGGAADFLTKPFTDDELLSAVRQALDRLALRRSPVAKQSRAGRHGLVGESPQMLDVFEQIMRAARTNATVLICGESGTGKELVARAIHYESQRAAAPFLPLNCGAIPHELMESTLFGHVKGAFTGASETRAGFFLTAEGGTIFLDEISETGAPMQVKLLRVLQNKEITMVGSVKPRQVDVRVVVATNKNLDQLVRSETFREDLYFRINVLRIEVPPLRERRADIPLLTRHFLDKMAEELGRTAPQLSDRALRCFTGYSWPGNVRELENVVQRLLVMCDAETVHTADLPPHMRPSGGVASALDDPQLTLAEVEARHIRVVLQSVDGNKTLAARRLGIDRKTLRHKLRQQGLAEDGE